jgi:hypothetical protein
MTNQEALARVWATMDGKLEAFLREKSGDISVKDPSYTGHYEGYMIEADAVIDGLAVMGFKIVEA